MVLGEEKLNTSSLRFSDVQSHHYTLTATGIQEVSNREHLILPIKNSWTRQYMKTVFGQNQDHTIKRLFDRASELVQEQDINPKAFKDRANLEKALDQ